MGQYLRASKKQLEYIANLCDQLGIINPTLYSKYRLEDAAKLINRLKKRKAKRDAEARQLRLF